MQIPYDGHEPGASARAGGCYPPAWMA
jgi:hypothetical protein